MGNCIQQCLPKSSSNHRNDGNQNVYSGHDFMFLIEEEFEAADKNKTSFLSRILAKRKRRKKPKKPVLELVDEILNPEVSPYCRLNESHSQQMSSTGSYGSRDIPLQCLDARALLARTNTSTPASSLDLEWEHETLPISLINEQSGGTWTMLPEDISQCPSDSSAHNSLPHQRHGSDSEWSRVSSINSLEWDSVQNSLQITPPPSELDPDTQQLLCEIERLTLRTLQETGKELYS